ncbi:MAG TPA: CheR family methyltransferase [Ancylobacter sp.]
MKTAGPPSSSTLALVHHLFVERFGLLASSLTDAELAHRLDVAFAPDADLSGIVQRALDQPLDGPDLQRLIAAVTIRESCFIRHLVWFEGVGQHVLAPLIAARRVAGRRDLTLWSAGCSAGEEAYSLGLLLTEFLPDIAEWQINIIGTDICALALEEARRGIYRPWSLREVSHERREAHFKPRGASVQVSARLRAMVQFELGNLLDENAGPWPTLMPNFDVILCRNVLMHLEPSARRRVAHHLTARLSPDGALATAPSEASPELFQPLNRCDHDELLVFRRPQRLAAAPRPAPPRAELPPVITLPVDPLPDVAIDISGVALDIRGSADFARGIEEFLAAGRIADARRLCSRATTANPLDAGLVHLLATLQEIDGDPDAACRSLRQALYIDQADGRARLRLAGLNRRSHGAADTWPKVKDHV